MKQTPSRLARALRGGVRPAARLSAWQAALKPALLALPALLAGAPAHAAVQFIATDLGTLGGTSSSANGINAAGVVVGTNNPGRGTSSGFVWQSGTMRALGYGSLAATAINDAGMVAGYGASNTILVDASGNGYSFGTSSGTRPGPAINAAGVVASSDLVAGAYGAVLFQVGRPTVSLSTAPGFSNGSSNGINAGGQVVGQALTSGNYHAVLWQAGVMVDLGTLPNPTTGTSVANAINTSGQIVGLSSSSTSISGPVAALWQGGYVQNLGTLGGGSGSAKAINDAGLIVGQSQISDGTQRGFLRTGSGGLQDLNTLLVAGSTATVTDAAGINANGQIAGTATFAGQSHAVLLTPTGSVAWQGTGSGGSFNSAANWEQGFGTSAFLDASIAPTGTQTVVASADAAVKTLTLGGAAGSSGRPTLALQSGATITAAGGVTVQATGTLTGDGTVRANLTNYGTLTAANVSITGSFTNAGLVNGSGIINTNLNNGASGQVRSGAGDQLQIIGTAHSNAGTIDISGGGSQQYTGALSNGTGARILLNNGVLRANGGLTNAGQVQVSFGGATVYGPVTTTAGGAVILSGNSDSTFYDAVDVKSGGELRVSGGSTGVFFGQVYQRTGSVFSGTGTKFYEGGLSVGNSPGLGTDAGSVNFGVANTYLEEIGGTTAGTGYDKYIVAGNLGFGGTLKVVSWNNFNFAAGQHFDIFDWGSSSGTFASIDLSGAALGAGLAWDTSALYSTGVISVTAVPEPQGWAMLLAGLGAVAGVARRRRAGAEERRG